MKTRNLIGGAIVVAFVAGGYLGGIFPKLGLGTGNRTGSGPQYGVTNVSRTTGDRDAPEDADSSKVLHVRIDGRQYFLVRAGNDAVTSLEKLVEQVQNYPGDTHGIRVRVSRSPTSKTTAEIQLRDALVAGGLSEDEIDWQDGPRP
ncbi:MAG TPA: hypothetical protein VL475_14650 [Planctomycetaceae bacterium]|jgi:hypothetical protein|nr:hypothetical protein [Planctomycetaceae bacterium]